MTSNLMATVMRSTTKLTKMANLSSLVITSAMNKNIRMRKTINSRKVREKKATMLV